MLECHFNLEIKGYITAKNWKTILKTAALFLLDKFIIKNLFVFNIVYFIRNFSNLAYY